MKVLWARFFKYSWEILCENFELILVSCTAFNFVLKWKRENPNFNNIVTNFKK